MIPVTQTKVVVRNTKDEMVVRGNCYAAAIASILEMPITDVPNVEVLFHLEDDMCDTVMAAWLRSFGKRIRLALEYIIFHPDARERYLKEGYIDAGFLKLWETKRDLLSSNYYFVSGLSSRGVSHITIWKAGTMVWDPHPTREGITTHDYFQVIDDIPQ